MIHLVRHGQTEFNRDGRPRGQCDSPLAPLSAIERIDCEPAALASIEARR